MSVMTGHGLFYLLLCTLSTITAGLDEIDFYTTTINTKPLVATHDQLVRILRKYEAAVTVVSSVLKRYLNESEVAQVRGTWETDGDPLKTFKLIRRTSSDLDELVTAIRKMRSLDPVLEIDNLRHARSLPNSEDLNGTAMSIIRLQRAYLLPPSDLVKGKLTERIETPVKLSPSDCLLLGQTSEELTEVSKIPVDSKLWYQTGLDLAQGDSTQKELRDHLEEKLSRLRNRTAKLFDFPQQFLDHINKDVLDHPLPPETNQNYTEMIFRKLCRGENVRAPSMDKDNYCHVRHGPHPYLKLRPLKLEVLNQEPYLVLLHEIIGNNEAETLKQIASKKISRSVHVAPDNSFTASSSRVSGTSWIGERHVPSLTARLEIILGMKANSSSVEAEPYQVLNYGVGGHYSIHQDYFPDESADIHRSYGNRIATLILYLSDVQEGGATAFPHLGLAVKANKGSGAFWWNLRNGGIGDYQTTHGACPVIYGTKWVSNKWFRLYGQMFHVPCGLQEGETLRRF